MNRKHASIRYATADGSFEIELEDVPAIFEVSHATGRYVHHPDFALLGTTRVGVVSFRTGSCAAPWWSVYLQPGTFRSYLILLEASMAYSVRDVLVEVTFGVNGTIQYAGISFLGHACYLNVSDEGYIDFIYDLHPHACAWC